MNIGETRIFYPAGILRTIDMAEGKLDVAVLLQSYISPWDLAAEKAFLEELGFNYSYLDGSEIPFTDKKDKNNAGYLICPKSRTETLSSHIIRHL
ncbi:MAG: hypothetical protein IPJ74_18445 [Saprospiraceae bacterium]|nr:hypothetical protein [Saprospiraceae bacterium]